MTATTFTPETRSIQVVPPKAAFATVRVDAAIYAFSIATEQ